MKLINLAAKPVNVEDMTPEQQEQYMKKPVEVVAVLSRNQYQMIRTGEAEIEVPNGVEMDNKAGSRTLIFACPNRDIAEELMDGLDSSGIVWEEDTSQEVNLENFDQ